MAYLICSRWRKFGKLIFDKTQNFREKSSAFHRSFFDRPTWQWNSALNLSFCKKFNPRRQGAWLHFVLEFKEIRADASKVLSFGCNIPHLFFVFFYSYSESSLRAKALFPKYSWGWYIVQSPKIPPRVIRALLQIGFFLKKSWLKFYLWCVRHSKQYEHPACSQGLCKNSLG